MGDATRPSVPSMRWVPGPTEHLAHVIIPAIERFATEDNCTVEEWLSKAVRSVAVARLSLEAQLDRRDYLCAERTAGNAGSRIEESPDA